MIKEVSEFLYFIFAVHGLQTAAITACFGVILIIYSEMFNRGE